MGKPKLALQVPVDYTIVISADGASDSLLHGTLSFSNVPTQCDFQIALARVGRLEKGKKMKPDSASRKLMGELGLIGSQKEQKREQFDYETAEKLCVCSVGPPQERSGSKTAKCEFSLPIPSYLPATAMLPSVNISYAIFATCILPDRKVLQTCQDLRIIRKTVKPIRLEPSRTVYFPDTSFAVRASFGPPTFSSKNTTIATTVQLNGLSLPITNSMRFTETRWLVPREIRWVLEKTAVIVTGCLDATGHLPMSSAQRILKRRKLATGREKLKLRYPFTRPGNTPISMHSDGSGFSVPLTVLGPRDLSLDASTALSVAGGHVLHTILDESNGDLNELQRRFAVYLECELHIWLRIGEDVFDEASGNLVNRKMDEMAYTIVCPLTTSRTVTGQHDRDDQDEPVPMIPPSYDQVWEQPPPEYATPSGYMAAEAHTMYS
ncbi:hypothetical protein AA0119_g11924 [Alternaria tenuissima]|uniref:Arrestin-like N-terminal domain-containing protein n=1 Tax=Alternaria tenuissima TaxID=119927 RepID=A0AB37VZM3_9PLEO|nr:hypothetical protein AA0115_g12293 [Alternaria tenuissima]RYN88327.1 hypothetical protein AA0119_g11924 [Alternaria tenuissima]RYO05257.1 hypothetical protein AA0121_g12568 [Alternaria tenuissima]